MARHTKSKKGKKQRRLTRNQSPVTVIAAASTDISKECVADPKHLKWEGKIESSSKKKHLLLPSRVSEISESNRVISATVRRRQQSPYQMPIPPCTFTHRNNLAAATAGTSYTPFLLAVYRPASLFVMLLFAALLPRNTFSLRWLALSHHCCSYCSGQYCSQLQGGSLFCKERSSGSGQYTLFLAMAMDSLKGVSLAHHDTETFIMDDESYTVASSFSQYDEHEFTTRFNSEVLNFIPRGGAASPDDQHVAPHVGLINLGNTCYLNAQLQCAYHVPLLRKLVMDAKDELYQAELEVEPVEEEVLSNRVCSSDKSSDGVKSEPRSNHESSKSSELIELAEKLLDESESRMLPVPETRASEATVRKTITRIEQRPISHALRALQQTFNSLAPGSGQSSGSTQALCHSLGINPYIQQDGQEFWKLFLPEVDYGKLTELYTGKYDDYIRELIPERRDLSYERNDPWEEKKDDDDGMMLQLEEIKPRERVRTDLFLDLSIPVTGGTGCSVEASLRETFVQPEILRVSEGNGWRPSKDAEKVDAYKGLSLRQEGLPSLLQLHLKRFKYDWETGETSKINDCCTFPEILDLSDILSKDNDTDSIDNAIYDLQSVVVHKGEYGSGHYYSYVRPNIESSDWFRFDDEIVTPVDFSDVVADAYGGIAGLKRCNSIGDTSAHIEKRKTSILHRIFSFTGIGRARKGAEFGYGGRASSAYMLQYVRRSDIPKLY